MVRTGEGVELPRRPTWVSPAGAEATAPDAPPPVYDDPEQARAVASTGGHDRRNDVSKADVDAETLEKLTAAVERMEASQREAHERVEKAAAGLPSVREPRAAASKKLRDYHAARAEDPSLPRTRSGRSQEGRRDGS